MNNATRRQLLERHKQSGFPGSIIDVFNAYNQGIDLISQFEMSSQSQMQVANTPQQQQEGLRPFHQQGQTNQSMVFPNVPPNTNFNTVGMKAPINIKKIDNQGNLVKSYENVPPGIQSLPTGPVGGTVIETPANMQSGGVKSDSKAVRSSQWPPELDFLDQEERFRRSLTGNVLPPAEVIGYRSIPEKNRRVDEKAHYADGTMNVDKFIAMGKLTGWKPWIMDIVHNGYSGHDRTAQDENVIEFFDGTGISSWDDAARAYIDWEVSDRIFPTLTEAGNILSAFPGANIIKGAKFGLTKFQKLKNIYARTVKGNNYINAAEDARQELIESKSNKKYGGVRKYQSGSSPDPDLAPGITQLPVADVQTDRVPYSKISDNSRMMGVGWAKPFFETAGNNPDSKLYKIGQRILDEREQDLARAEMALEFTSVPGLMRTAERLKGKDPLRTIAKEGKMDLLSTLPLAGGMYKGLRLAGKSAENLYDTYKLSRAARNVPEQLPGSGNVAPQQMGLINTKGAFQKYPKGKLTQEEIDAFKNSDYYKQTTKEHLDSVNRHGDRWKLPNYAEENLQNAIRTGNRSYINPILYGGDNWGASNYLIAGLAASAYPGTVGIMGLASSPPAIKNRVLNNLSITSTPGVLSSKDTTINITDRPMDFAKVNEVKDGQIIIGGEFIESANNTVRKAKDWLTASDTYSDKKYSSRDVQSFYGIENGKFKVGKASDFKPDTEIVPRRFGATNISQAVLNEGAMRLLDDKGNPIYQNTPNTGKFILYSPSTKEAEFDYITTGKSGVDKVNKFLRKNKDAQYIHLDNGRYEFYGLNPGGLSEQDFRDYYQQDLERKGNPGYNMIIKKSGGIVKMQEKKYKGKYPSLPNKVPYYNKTSKGG